MTRRSFLFNSLGAIAAFSLTLIGCREKVSSKTTALYLPELLSLLVDEKTIREIGMAYISLAPNQTTNTYLISLLMTDSNGKKLSNTASASTIRADLGKKIVVDFKKGNYLFIDGWVISETEAQQCALFSLSQK
jgi:hypothetical protein